MSARPGSGLDAFIQAIDAFGDDTQVPTGPGLEVVYMLDRRAGIPQSEQIMAVDYYNVQLHGTSSQFDQHVLARFPAPVDISVNTCSVRASSRTDVVLFTDGTGRFWYSLDAANNMLILAARDVDQKYNPPDNNGAMAFGVAGNFQLTAQTANQRLIKVDDLFNEISSVQLDPTTSGTFTTQQDTTYGWNIVNPGLSEFGRAFNTSTLAGVPSVTPPDRLGSNVFRAKAPKIGLPPEHVYFQGDIEGGDALKFTDGDISFGGPFPNSEVDGTSPDLDPQFAGRPWGNGYEVVVEGFLNPFSEAPQSPLCLGGAPPNAGYRHSQIVAITLPDLFSGASDSLTIEAGRLWRRTGINGSSLDFNAVTLGNNCWGDVSLDTEPPLTRLLRSRVEPFNTHFKWTWDFLYPTSGTGFSPGGVGEHYHIRYPAPVLPT